MKIKRFILVFGLTLVTTACSSLMVSYVKNAEIVNGDLNVDIIRINDGVPYDAQSGFYPYFPFIPYSYEPLFDHSIKVVTVDIWIANNSFDQIKTNLNDAVLMEGDKAYHASMYVQGDRNIPTTEMNPIRVLNPGEAIERLLLYKIQAPGEPNAFIWKGVGKISIPSLAQRDE